jgi:hypothetical protein
MRITPEALKLFKALKAGKNRDRWWRINSALHRELELPPWEYPGADGDPGFTDRASINAQARWQQLEKALAAEAVYYREP